MNRKTTGRMVRFGALLLIGAVLPANAENNYSPRIPPGYTGEVVLHVDYGDTPDKIRILWGKDPGAEGTGPTSVEKLIVVHDRFYLMDSITRTIKQYRSPGTFVWETQSMEGLSDYAIAPDGKVYAIWGDHLSRFDTQGRLLWTKTRDSVVSKGKLEQLGMSSSLPGFYLLEGWTIRGLVVIVGGWDHEGSPMNLSLLLDADGKLLRHLPGSFPFVAPDGVLYDVKPTKGPLPSTIVEKDEKGKVKREIRPGFGPDKATRTAGSPVRRRTLADPAGGFAVHASASLPARIPVAKGLTTGIEEILWRFDVQGNLEEEWRFPVSPFAVYHPEIVIGPDGSVYHLEFGEEGIDVVKYSRPGKGNPPNPKE